MIRYQRMLKNLSQEELAQKISVSPTAVCKWENDVRKPSLKNMRKLERFFGAPIREYYYKLPDTTPQESEEPYLAEPDAKQKLAEGLSLPEVRKLLLRILLGEAVTT